ncbi:uncharacterized protein RJT20DRAFT_133733 [Scheffersomyces xylosifermentans]|uniref:uncharacterized protein n=1 Tax=Scheffersomyces xylosifermentans TaxID=1304137 RepID=UPI00315C697B
MDFEEQLEKAEKLESPSLVGSSVRSADDSPHNNYIHPEKYKAIGKEEPAKKPYASLMNSSIAASLDDLINEGALLGSEEDFDKFLDSEGKPKDDIKYLPGERASDESVPKEKKSVESKKSAELEPKVHHEPEAEPEHEDEEELDDHEIPNRKPAADEEPRTASNFYKQDDYSTPNLSEYQVENNIQDHSELLSNIKSIDPHRLPNSAFKRPDPPKPTASYTSSSKAGTPISSSGLDHSHDRIPHVHGQFDAVVTNDGIHSPYFHTDSRSRSISSDPSRRKERSSSRSAFKPHLARGDSYKNTHEVDPTKYELPAELEVNAEGKEVPDEDEGDDRRTRHSRPTMGESIAIAEAKAQEQEAGLPKDPSLVTTGDYTNFNVDNPSNEYSTSNLYATRSISSTNYLRSISRSRSRARPVEENEKNDANPEELVREGALINEDPYSTIDHLDTMVEEVLHPKSAEGASAETDGTVTEGEATKAVAKEGEDKAVPGTVKEIGVVHEGAEGEEKEEETTPLKMAHLDKSQESEKLESNTTTDKTEGEGEEEETAPLKTSSDKVDKEEEEKTELEIVAKKEDVDEETDSLVKTPLDKLDKEEEKTEPKAVAKEDEVEEEEEKESVPASETTADDSEKSEEKKESEDEITEKNDEVEVEDKKKDLKEDEGETKEPIEKQESSSKGGIVAATTGLVAATAGLVAAKTGLVTGDKKDEDEKEAEEDTSESTESKDEDKPESKEAVEPKEIDEAVKKEDEAVDAKDFGDSTTKEVKADVEEPKTKEVVPETKKSDVDDDLDDLDISPEELRKHLESQPIYIYTSLAGGMMIMQRTNRLVTILQANGIKFEYRDLGTDENAKKLWKRQAEGKTLPGIVRGDDFMGNWEKINDVNEEYKLRELLYETL